MEKHLIANVFKDDRLDKVLRIDPKFDLSYHRL